MYNIEKHIMNNDEEISLFEYIRENFIGLLLLILAFFIIYLVDYISRINSLIFSIPSPIPGVTNSINIQPISKRKFKNKK